MSTRSRKSYEDDKKQETLSTMQAIQDKLASGEFKIESSGWYWNDHKLHFKVVLLEAPVEVLAEEE